MKHRDVRGPGKARGASLIESLLAVVVLGLATLAALALFTRAAQASRAALLQQQAITAVADLAEQLRADAGADTASWLQQIAQRPPFTGQVTTASTNGLDLWTLSLQWRDPSDGRPAAFASTLARPAARGTP